MKLDLDFLLREPTGLCPQHRRDLIQVHSDLVAHWNKTLGKIPVVFLQQLHGHHDVVDITEDQRVFPGVGVLLLDESDWMLSPMTPGVEVMGGVVSVVVTISIALCGKRDTRISSRLPRRGGSWVQTDRNVDQSNT